MCRDLSFGKLYSCHSCSYVSEARTCPTHVLRPTGGETLCHSSVPSLPAAIYCPIVLRWIHPPPVLAPRTMAMHANSAKFLLLGAGSCHHRGGGTLRNWHA
jgi:hypothetical protein